MRNKTIILTLHLNSWRNMPEQSYSIYLYNSAPWVGGSWGGVNRRVYRYHPQLPGYDRRASNNAGPFPRWTGQGEGGRGRSRSLHRSLAPSLPRPSSGPSSLFWHGSFSASLPISPFLKLLQQSFGTPLLAPLRHVRFFASSVGSLSSQLSVSLAVRSPSFPRFFLSFFEIFAESREENFQFECKWSVRQCDAASSAWILLASVSDCSESSSFHFSIVI